MKKLFVSYDTALNESQEILLMKFSDGQCSTLERFFVRRLLKGSEQARNFLSELDGVTAGLHDWAAPQGEVEEVDLWRGVERRIVLGERRLEEDAKEGSITEWIGRLGWGISGGLVAASALLLVVGNSGGNFVPANFIPRMMASSSTASPSSVVAPVSFGSENNNLQAGDALVQNGFTHSGVSRGLAQGSRYHSIVEADWLRSEGTLRFIQNPDRDSTIIWVKKGKTNPKFKAPRIKNTPQVMLSMPGTR